jgi:hypothetical protein
MTIKETRFAFGENWATFSEKVTEERIDAAIEGLRRLFANGEPITPSRAEGLKGNRHRRL